jgi:hypothetical protein
MKTASDPPINVERVSSRTLLTLFLLPVSAKTGRRERMSSRQDNGITAHLTSILCWTFLPSLFTNLLLSTFYRLSPSSRPTLPPNASPPQVASANSTAQRHFRRARITLVISYLVYSILNVYWSQSTGVNQNYYSLLGLSRDAVEIDGPSAVKSQWRRLARIYHPDKVGKAGEQRFVELRRGVEILENDNKRWAYERFGPSIAEWGKLVTNREFLVKGATNAGAFWVFASLSIAGVSFFRKEERRNKFVSSASDVSSTYSLLTLLLFRAVALSNSRPLRLPRIPFPPSPHTFTDLLLPLSESPHLRAHRAPPSIIHLDIDGNVSTHSPSLPSPSPSCPAR